VTLLIWGTDSEYILDTSVWDFFL